MNLRPYQDDDWVAVCEIYDLSKPDELRGVVAAESIVPLAGDAGMCDLFCESTIVVGEVEGRVVAFAGRRGAMITWLFVHPQFRRRGVGSALVRHLIASSAEDVALNVASGNRAARALYEWLGFELEREFVGNFQGQPCYLRRLRRRSAR